MRELHCINISDNQNYIIQISCVVTHHRHASGEYARLSVIHLVPQARKPLPSRTRSCSTVARAPCRAACPGWRRPGQAWTRRSLANSLAPPASSQPTFRMHLRSKQVPLANTPTDRPTDQPINHPTNQWTNQNQPNKPTVTGSCLRCARYSNSTSNAQRFKCWTGKSFCAAACNRGWMYEARDAVCTRKDTRDKKHRPLTLVNNLKPHCVSCARSKPGVNAWINLRERDRTCLDTNAHDKEPKVSEAFHQQSAEGGALFAYLGCL